MTAIALVILHTLNRELTMANVTRRLKCQKTGGMLLRGRGSDSRHPLAGRTTMNLTSRRSIAMVVFLFVLARGGADLFATGVTIFNVKDYGATGVKADNAQPAIQKAIDACAAAGGGQVYLPPGEYTSGTLKLRSHVRFDVEAGATLYGSTEPKDFGDAPT